MPQHKLMTCLLCDSELIKLKLSQYVHGWFMRDNFMAFLKGLCSAVILVPKQLNTKFAYLLGSPAISVM